VARSDPCSEEDVTLCSSLKTSGNRSFLMLKSMRKDPSILPEEEEKNSQDTLMPHAHVSKEEDNVRNIFLEKIS
jgi:hypothetical protein